MLEVGQKFNMLTIEKYLGKDKHYHKFYLCKCDCGNTKIIEESALTRKNNNTISCGCFRKKRIIESHLIHNEGHGKTRLYRIWRGMKARCYTKSHSRFKDYGGRGIIVCDQWKNNYLTFKEWAISNGYSDDLSIDRINVNGNYEPSNCRWADAKAQNNNKRRGLARRNLL